MNKNLGVLAAILMFSILNFGCTDAKEVEKSTTGISAQQPAIAPPLLVPEVNVSKWIEGTHYNVLNDEVSLEKEVVEYFSFWCPACYRFESVIDAIKLELAEDVSFKKVHVNFMSFTTENVQEQATKAMLIGRLLGKEELLNAAIFAHIHEQAQQIEGMGDLKQLFISYDIPETELDKLLNDDTLQALLSQNNNQIAKFREYLSGVPNIIVNGKYQAKFTRDMTMQDVIDLINWLSLQK